MPDERAPRAPSEESTVDERGSSPSGSFGRYRLLQRIGEGGMGEVWLAEQVEPVRRQVAVKVIKAGMDSAQVVARFEAERQALALMDHPAIATVFDGGTTPQGRSYFAMEHVKGEPITAYCDKHRLGTRERLELFTQVCEGVQHAHQKGIIHRDLKPSNVLVTLQGERPVPKIIDFGVAKATTRHLTERGLFTELGVLVGTPEYMSPEQAEMSGLDVDTRTDIYALGVLLYELLTGSLPFDRQELRGAGIVEIQRIIREKEPPRPSTRLTQLGPASTEAAWNRQTEPRRLVSELRGDLDWITMRALEKDRTRRYQTANALALDVRRHLSHEPVSAGPPGAAYRASKFVRRHRVGVGAAVALAVLLVAFGVTMAVQARRIGREADRANREAAAATQVSDFLVGLFQVSDPSEARGNTVTAREILDKGAAHIDQELEDQPSIRARLMETIGMVYSSLGLYERAGAMLERAVALNRRTNGDDDLTVATALYKLAIVYANQGRYEESAALHRQALEIRTRRLGPADPDVARSLNSLAAVRWSQGRLDEAGPLFERALAAKEQALGSDHAELATTLGNLGVLEHSQENYAEAEAYMKRGLAITERERGPDHPDVATILNNLGALYVDAGRRAEAEPVYARCLAIWQKALGPDHPDVGIAVHNLANLYRDLGRYAEAEPLYLRAQAVWEKSLGPDHPYVGTNDREHARLREAQGRDAEAASLYARALRLFERRRERNDEIETLEGYVPLLERMGRTREAAALTRRLTTLRNGGAARAEGAVSE